MSKRISTKTSQGRDYERMLKEYFGFHLFGLEVSKDGGQVQAQVVYEDFKHTDTVRRELAQLMPEVEFTKLRRDFTESACAWVLKRIMWEETNPNEHTPVVYVKHGEDLIRTTVRDIAVSELRQLELDANDETEINYTDMEHRVFDSNSLRQNSWG